MRDKNGRYTKRPNIEIYIPSFYCIIKYLILFFILSPWLYTLMKFDILSVIENGFDSIFGPKVINECRKESPPY